MRLSRKMVRNSQMFPKANNNTNDVGRYKI